MGLNLNRRTIAENLVSWDKVGDVTPVNVREINTSLFDF